MAQMTEVTRHKNRHFVVKIYNSVIFVMKLLVVKKTFKEIPSRGLEDNGKNTNIDLF